MLSVNITSLMFEKMAHTLGGYTCLGSGDAQGYIRILYLEGGRSKRTLLLGVKGLDLEDQFTS